MTILASSGFESGSIGSNVPTDGTDFFTGGSTQSGTSCVYDDAHVVAGGRSIHYSCGTSNGYLLRHVSFTAASVGAIRRYLYFTDVPADNVAIMSVWDGSTKVADVQFRTTGGLRLRNVSTAVGSELAVPLNQLVRVEWKIDPGGNQNLQLHYGTNLHSATASLSTSGLADGTSATTVDEFRTGMASYVSGWDYWGDEYAVGNTDFCGPITVGGGTVITAPASVVTMAMPSVDGGRGQTIRPTPGWVTMRAAPCDVVISDTGGTQVIIDAPRFAIGVGSPGAAYAGGTQDEDTYTVELNLDGTWVDVTAAVDGNSTINIHYGRSSRWDDIGPGTASFVLDNRTGDFSPDNPTSTYWPHFTEGAGVRVTAWRTGVAYPLFTGTIDSLDLDAGHGTMPASSVSVSASDGLARLGRAKSRPLPEVTALSWPGLATYLPFDDPVGAVTARNLGKGAAAQQLPGSSESPSARVEVPKDYPGQWSFGADPEGLTFDGSFTVTRNADHLSGPVLHIPICETRGNIVHAVEFWVNTTDKVPTGGTEIVLWSCTDGHGVCLTAGYNAAGKLRLTSPARYVYAEQVWQATTGATLNDGAWHHVRLRLTTGADTEVSVDGIVVLVTSTWLWANETEHYLGGRAAWHNPGRQTLVGSAQFAGYAVTMESQDWDSPGSLRSYGLLSTTTTAEQRITTQLTAAGVTLFSVSDDATPVGGAKVGSESVLASLQTVCRTTGGVLYASPMTDDDAPERVDYRAAEWVRPSTPVAVIDVEDDLHTAGGLRWERTADNRPTRVTASSPGAGSATAVDTTRESDSTFVQEVTFDTVAPTSTRLLELAHGRLAATAARRRLAVVTVDLLTATTTDLWDALYRPSLGDRVRVTGLPSDYLGVTYEDGIVEGVTLQVSFTGQYLVTMDLSPADNPVEAVFDSDEYGRFTADGTLSLAATVDADDTVLSVSVTAGYPALSTDSGDYPLDLRIGDERVTVASAPSGPSGAIDAARAKLADVSTTPFSIVCYGDSITEGAGASTLANRWIDKLQKRLRTDYPVTGVSATTPTYVPAFYSMDTPTDWVPWESPVTTGDVISTTGGLGARTVHLGNTETITFTGSGDRIDVHYVKTNFLTGSFSVAIDGSTVANLTSYDAGVGGGVSQSVVWTSDPLADTSHTVVITGTSVYTAIIAGVQFYDGDYARSIHVYDAGHGGWTANDHKDASHTSLAVVQADLAVIALGFNDAWWTWTPAQFDSNLDTLITNIRAQVSNIPILLVGYYNPRDAEAGWATPDWSQYIDAMATVAGSTTYAELLDLSETMPDTWEDPSLYADQVHPNDDGHAALATYIADWIEGGAVQSVTVTRGVAPTVATAHAAGTDVDVWNAATYAI